MADDQLALFDTDVTDTHERELQINRRLLGDIALFQQIETNPSVDNISAKSIRAHTGRVAAKQAVSHGKIWNFIDKIGINSEEQRAKDGLLLKKFRAQREQPIVPARETLSTPPVIDEQAPVAEVEDDTERRIREIAAFLSAKTYEAIAKQQPLQSTPSTPSPRINTKSISTSFPGSSEPTISKNEKKKMKRSWFDRFQDKAENKTV